MHVISIRSRGSRFL